ncbi:SH3 domain-containing protein [Parasphingorhabdus flavimaris]|uniref:SH3 domain-containing protein n=1 Tax=Parasphingorhabdus flavimaris TaxID=266812 RepID=UPI0030015F44
MSKLIRVGKSKSFSKSLTGVLVGASLVAGSVAVPINAANAQQRSTLSDMIDERNQKQIEHKKKNNTGSKIFGAVIGAGTFLLCGGGKKNASLKTKVGCAALGGLAGYATYLIGKKISKKVDEKDRATLLSAAGDTLRSGEPQTINLPNSNATASVSLKKDAVIKEADVEVLYDQRTVATLDRIEVVAEPYRLKSGTNLRAGPSTDHKITGKLKKNDVIFVSGKVADQPWMLVSKQIVEGSDSAQMNMGYIHKDQLLLSEYDVQFASNAVPSTVANGTIRAVLKCAPVNMHVRDQNGKTTKGNSYLCVGPEGLPISA